jgi:hypothetical protein
MGESRVWQTRRIALERSRSKLESSRRRRCDCGVDVSIPRPYRERVGGEGEQRETLRGENPAMTGVSRVSPGQRVGSFRAHNPKVAGSNPAPATNETLGNPTVPGVSSRLGSGRNRPGARLGVHVPGVCVHPGRDRGSTEEPPDRNPGAPLCRSDLVIKLIAS